MITKEIKKYCKDFGYKFEKHIENGFITSKKVKLFAGMREDKIKCVGFKTVYEKHLCFEDGDIIGNGYVNEI